MTDQVYAVDKSLTAAEGKALWDSKWWEGKTATEITRKQLFTERLIMPMGEFVDAVAGALGRSVYTHELAAADSLRQEFCKLKAAPTFAQVLDMIPKDKLLVVEMKE